MSGTRSGESYLALPLQHFDFQAYLAVAAAQTALFAWEVERAKPKWMSVGFRAQLPARAAIYTGGSSVN